MKRNWKNIFLLIISFTLFFSSFSIIARAEEETDEEELVQELAEQLKFIYEEASIKDEDGNVIDLNVEMIEEKYGSSPELEEVKKEQSIEDKSTSEPVITPMNAKLDKCLNSKIKNGFKDIISLSAITTVIEYVKSGKYTLAAGRLIKIGVKGNTAGIAAQLILWWGQCNYKVNGW